MPYEHYWGANYSFACIKNSLIICMPYVNGKNIYGEIYAVSDIKKISLQWK